MIPVLHIFVTSLNVQNVHGWFRFSDVKHLLNTGVSTSSRDHLYKQHSPRVSDEPTQTRGVVYNTCFPRYVVLSMTDTGTHGFLHDESAVCKCYWANDLTVFDKIQVVKQLVIWLGEKKTAEHNLIDNDDAQIFEVVKALLHDH